MLQQGYAVGYLLAAVINLGIVPKSSEGWKCVFYFGAGISFLAAIVRAIMPETETYLRAREEAAASGQSSGDMSKRFWEEVKAMLRANWIRTLWAICLMTGASPISGWG